ncbi:MAG: hypothetical protein J6P61_03500 [Erysipelotrichaceae bacterium]|nr:hypothetical protein [Erysipelotrichaceae bacterium]
MSMISRHQYYDHLPPNDQKIYDTLLDGFIHLKREVLVENIPCTNSIFTICRYITFDHPDVFWIDYYGVITRYSGPKYNVIEMPYYFNDEEIMFYLRRVRAWRSTIIAGIDKNLPASEKLRLVFDYFERRTTYGREDMKFSQTIVGPCRIDNEVSVCEGIAKSLKYLCDAMDIPCMIPYGEVHFGPRHLGKHAWNIVDLDGIYRHIDGVNYLSEGKVYGKVKSDFLKTDRQMKVCVYNDKPLYSWDESMTPECL